MTDITTMLHDALDGEPPMGLQPADVVRRGLAASRRHRVVAGAATSAGVLGVAAVAATVVSGSSGSAHPPRAAHTVTLRQLSAATGRSAAAPHHRVAAKAGEHVAGVTGSTLVGLVERSLGVGLVDPQVSSPAADGSLNLGAGLDLAGHPYLNVQLIPAGEVSPTADTCADLDDLASPDTDGYTGSCTLSHLAGGGLLIVRDSRTPTGGYAKVAADLLLPDGSAIVAENDNQQAEVTPAEVTKADHKHAVAPITGTDPALSTTTIAQLVQDLAAAES